jgi:hypothetical protein
MKHFIKSYHKSARPDHLTILEGVLTQAKKTFSQLELMAITCAHVAEYCQNRHEKRQAYRIGAKILKCDRHQLQRICEKLIEIETRLVAGGGEDNA